MKSKLSLMASTVVPLSLALVIGFSDTPKSYAGAAEPAEAQQSEADTAEAKPTAKKDLSRYKKVMLLPAELDSGEDAEFKGVPIPGQVAKAAYLTKSVADVLKEKGLLAERPGPGVAQLRLVVNDLEMKRKGGPAAPPPPFPIPDQPTGGASNGLFTGTASVTAKFTDSQTGETVESLITKETAKGDLMETLPKAIDKVVRKVGERLELDASSDRGKVVTEEGA